jgi:hypothetical protein
MMRIVDTVSGTDICDELDMKQDCHTQPSAEHRRVSLSARQYTKGIEFDSGLSGKLRFW